MYKTHFDRYVALRTRYIHDVQAGKDARPWLLKISNALRACIDVATLPETREVSQQLKTFGQQYLAAYDFSQPSPRVATIDHKHLLIAAYLNELRLGATEKGYLNHQHHDHSKPDIAGDQLSLSKDLLDALLDFSHINIFNARLLSNSDVDWPTKVTAYHTPLKYISNWLKRLDRSPLRAQLDFSILEKAYIDHSLDICRLALQIHQIDEAKTFLNNLIEMLQRIPSGYLEARRQCQQWLSQYLPDSTLRLDTSDTQALIASASNTEENRHKKENRQLAKWTQTVQDLPVASASSARLTEIQTRLGAKTSKREAYRQRQQALSEQIRLKLDAIQHFEAASRENPPTDTLAEPIGAIGPAPMLGQRLARHSSDYWGAYRHHHQALLIEAPKGHVFHTQSCLKMLDTSLAKCLNLKLVPLPQAITLYQDSVALLPDFEAWPELTLELGKMSLQRGWSLLQAIDADDEAALSNVLTCIEAALRLLLNTTKPAASLDSLVQQHQQQLAILPSRIGSTFRPSQETKLKTQPEDSSRPGKVTSESEKHKKQRLKACRQQKLDQLNQIETQIQGLSTTEPDNLLPLAKLAADLNLKQHGEKNPTVLQKIADLEALIRVKHGQLVALQPIEERTNSVLSEDDHTSHESLSPRDIDEPNDFATLALKPACLANPNYAGVIEQLKQIVQALGKNLYVFGSALYKPQPNDLDLLLHYQDTAVLRALLAKGAYIVGKYKKDNRHVLQVEWHGVKLDINLSHKTWSQHAQQLDFTVGAIYHNLNTEASTALHASALEHLQRKELHCAQPGGSLAMLQHDPSILFRALHLERHEQYRWSEEFTTAVDALAHQATNPFFSMNPDKLYQTMTRLFEHGHARANLERLIQLNLFEKLFGRIATLNEAQKDLVYFMARQAAASCDRCQQPASFMFYSIHWPWLSQNPVADRHAIAGQAMPRIELQKGPYPNWNADTHLYNLQCLHHNAIDYHHRLRQTHHSRQPPCQAHQQHYKKNKKPFAHPPGKHPTGHSIK